MTADSRRISRYRKLRHAFDMVLDTVEDPDTSSCEFERIHEVYNSEDLREAHEGLFRKISWTREERLKIADLHATQQYHLLGPFLKKKLNSIKSNDEYQKQIAEFFAEHYPPKIVRQLHSNESKCQIRKILSEANPNASLAATVAFERISKLSLEDQHRIQKYVLANSRPRDFTKIDDLANL